MAKSYAQWQYTADNRVSVVGGVKEPKKLTGTRLGAILGVNKYKTQFGAWCEICRVAEEPFEGNKFTNAGIIIEPKQVEWCKHEVSPHICTPEDWFGKQAEGTFLRDHFESEPVFGGKWDALVTTGKTTRFISAVIECKTSSRPQDWVDGVPANYAVQGLLYAALMGVDLVIFVVSFLEPSDYDYPEQFACHERNTFTYELRVSDSNIAAQIGFAAEWWNKHVVGNVSPEFDPKKDKEYLKVMRTNEVEDEGIEELAKKAILLETRIEVVRAESGLDALEKELKTLKDKQLKPAMQTMFTSNDEAVSAYGWRLKAVRSSTINKEAMAADNVLEKYTVPTVIYRLEKEKSNV